MIAEIHGKISSDGSNLSERLEDKLTGDIFGSLRYLPYRKGLYQILSGTKFLNNLHKQQFLESINLVQEEYVYESFSFWQKRKRSEIDLVLDLGKSVLGIEVKYNSGLSSENQLEREALDLIQINKVVPKFLILVGVEPEVNYIVSQVNSRNMIPSTVIFGYLSWQDILEQLTTIFYSEKMNPPEKLIIQDMVHLLERKGFKRFKDFQNLNLLPIIKRESFFSIDQSEILFFTNFSQVHVERTLYYEFK
ncbi:hypothetical protein CN520_00455 [Bacillus cereus]|uniref:hypothetical protein n=1 Tax=Bacillus cereus TaxID=1396 RepID=UPI000BEDDE13|nr:hypothetical protein [Bacillus cereus]PDZ39774.1 hypothetical protein CON18_12970 [Bacillus cereus]PET44014.1 hypothetical protein CN520_00455 [Bacillus cereus]PFA16780.1 hypothetical protein CN377_07025 [Bacillus cereus]PFS81168.1 hypothetical protein COK49_11210 [Bacillus cereus]PGS17365.1 hypothetical protein COC51_05470 [Bacillus cereus]